MEGLAKSAPTDASVKKEASTEDSRPAGELKEQEQLYGYFKLDKDDTSSQADREVGVIYDWAKRQTEGKENPDLLWEIASLRRKLGSPQLWENSRTQLYRYIRLIANAEDVKRKLKDMEGING